MYRNRKIPLLEDVESLTFGNGKTRLIVSYEDNVSLLAHFIYPTLQRLTELLPASRGLESR